ncbi:hypothetical protein HA075_20860 [bacterium BFN5]|nr:hypothetical protein HA075_20860 [bacterium BFN5]
MIKETLISIPETDRKIQDDIEFFMLFGWQLISVEPLGITIKYTIKWPRKNEHPIYPIKIK